MHWDNLGGLAPLLPLAMLLVVLAVALHTRTRWLAGQRLKEQRDAVESYWALEMAHRAKMHALSWIRGSRSRRLTWQPSADDAEIARSLAGNYGNEDMADREFSTRLSRAKFRAWHRGTREADFTIGGFYDRHHADWGEDELAWFEALLEEEDSDILAWAMATHAPPEKFQGRLMSDLQKLDYVSI